MDPELQSLSLQLADTVLRNTAGSVADRIKAVRASKKNEETIGVLEGIVSELIADKNESIRIAQAFEQKLVSQSISQDDIEYITGTIVPALRELVGQSSSVEDPSSAEAVMQAVESILSTEVVTVLQLLGFNFKQAIGEPLTELLRNSITSRTQNNPGLALEVQRLSLQREVLTLQVAQDADAYLRLGRLLGTAAPE